MDIIGFNHLFIDSGPLTGPGYYAVQLLENLLALPKEKLSSFKFCVFAQDGTQHHYSENTQRHLVLVPPQSSRFSRVAWEQIMLPIWSVRKKVDLLFSPGFVSPMYGAPILATTIPDMYYRAVPEFVERYQRLYWRIMLPMTSRVSKLVITISESSKRDIEHFLPGARGKVIVTPLASRFKAIDILDEDELSQEPYVLVIANLTPNKNISRVVEALAMLRDNGRVVNLLHIGVDLYGELARAVSEHNLFGQVKSLGKVDDDSLRTAARSCLCIIVPSLYEGFGMPAIEAQALGVPLICSDRSALPEVAGNAALMFDPSNTSELSGCISRLIEERGLRNKMRSEGLVNARRFSWKSTAQLTLDAFDRQLKDIRGFG